MENKFDRGRSAAASPAPEAGVGEPEVRRWVHPIPQPGGPALPESTMHYICCALSYQNELLSEIKVLLEQFCREGTADSPPGDQPPE
ncbi:hypothetical protein [Oscillibacter sp. GMB15532]|uniref:hypothetical protein n=1 Tax=Oscillibacter sp. GMB15532 TaxID=3230022 RepID=UPI0034DE940E